MVQLGQLSTAPLWLQEPQGLLVLSLRLLFFFKWLTQAKASNDYNKEQLSEAENGSVFDLRGLTYTSAHVGARTSVRRLYWA